LKKEKLQEFFGQFSNNDKVLIPIVADPDSIASAMAVKRLLWRKVSSITIAAVNTIKRPDNLTLIRLLMIKIIPIKEIDPNKYNRIVYVDSQPSHDSAFTRFNPNLIIDHHPDAGAVTDYQDIRPAYGATACILLEYLQIAKIKPSQKLATALYYAIKTDTDSFNRTTVYEDVKAFQYAFKFANIQWIKKIETSEMRPVFLKYFEIALKNYKKRKGWIFSHVGKISNPDVIVIVADFFLRVEDVNWSIVSGIYGKKLIVIFRSFGNKRNAGKVAQNSFGNLGSAGGHKSAARAEFLISSINGNFDYQNNDQVGNWIISQIQKKR
jgi:nanoRNase/pAp phosphatase (c-di-AMP/oligoRNAs hydrolase)